MTRTEALVRLQQVDLELIRGERALAALPQGGRIREIRAAAKKLAAELNKVVGERKDVEMELEENRAQHEKMAGLVDQVQADAADGPQDFRAARDLEQQLTHLAKRMEKLDFERGELEARLARLREAEQGARDVAGRLSEEGRAQAEAYRKAGGQIAEEAERLRAERDELVASLPAELVDRYEAARRRFGGIAVETLSGNRPSVCRVTLQPSDFSDIRHSGDEICECPYCHRILVTSTMFE